VAGGVVAVSGQRGGEFGQHVGVLQAMRSVPQEPAGFVEQVGGRGRVQDGEGPQRSGAQERAA
jgi:hypothetical protein